MRSRFVSSVPCASSASGPSPCTRRKTGAHSTSERQTTRISSAADRPSESYLAQERLIATALRAGADAVHPGYGFLAENAGFARAVTEAGLVWIGPPPDAMELMGLKTAARRLMSAAGVPVVPGTLDPVESVDEVIRLGEEYGWPVAVKAAAGGGGKGFKVVESPAEAERGFRSAQREGEAYFSDSTVYVEKVIEDPRHVEVQVLGDRHGTIIQLGERDCTIQRRHQKLVEETPSPAVGPELRAAIGEIAVGAARAAGYQSVGTVEGLLDRAGNYYFLEMNARIQVEHTVTEMATGVDLVREQLLVAAGEPISVTQDDVRVRGHAIECRINAEDAANGFLPAPGTITRYREPGGPGVRVDSGVEAGSEVSGLYDPLVAKLIVWDRDREHARRRMLRALEEYVIEGVPTLVDFHRALLSHQAFVAGETCHELVESSKLAAEVRRLAGGRSPVSDTQSVPPSRERIVVAEVDGRRFEVRLALPEPAHAKLARRRRERAAGGARMNPGTAAVLSPMQGTVLAVQVADGDVVVEGQVICVVEAMKMENEVAAHRPGTVGELSVAPGEQVTTGQVICRVTSESPTPGRLE